MPKVPTFPYILSRDPQPVTWSLFPSGRENAQSLCLQSCAQESPLSIPSCPCGLLWDQISLESSPGSSLPGNSHSFHHKESSQMRKNKLIAQGFISHSAFPLWSSLEPLVAGSLLRPDLQSTVSPAASLDVDLIMVVPSCRPFCTISNILVTGLLMSLSTH